MTLLRAMLLVGATFGFAACDSDDDGDDDDDTTTVTTVTTDGQDTGTPDPTETTPPEVPPDVTYVTYYGRDPAQIEALSTLDLAIVQPLLTSDQLRTLQTNAEVAVYLSIGEIGLSNTYLVDGEEVLGQVIYDAHPEWFLGKNPFFDSWFADTNQTGWQDFVLDQSQQLFAQGYDGLFLDTVDTVDVYPEIIPGMVRLIERLRAQHPGGILIQNRGINIIDQSGPSVSALMFEVFSSRYDFESESYVRTDLEAPGYPEIVDKAVAYRDLGGVVLAQDFALPDGTYDELICYTRDRALEYDFIPSYADKFFQDGRFAYPATCPWPVEPSLKLQLDPPIAHLEPGGSVTVEVAFAGDARPSDALTVKLEWAVAGLTVTIDDDQLEPSGTASVTVSADAGAPIGPQTLTLSVGSWFDLPVVIHEETVWVTNAGLSNVVAFDEPGALDPGAPPARRTGLVAQPYAVEVTDSGQTWVVENVGDPTAVQPAGRLLQYAPFELETPERIIESGLNYPTSVVLDGTGGVWVVNSSLDWTGTPRGTPNIAWVGSGATEATVAFTYAHLSYGWPLSATLGPDGRLWVSTTYGLVIGCDTRTDGNEVTPAAVLYGATGGGTDAFDTVRDIAFDGDGDLWLTARLQGASRVLEVPAGHWSVDGGVSQVEVADVTTLLSAGLYEPWGLDFGASGALWVVNSTDADDEADSRGSLVKFDALTTGAEPSKVIPLGSRFTLGVAVASP